MREGLDSRWILGMRVDSTSYERAVKAIVKRAKSGNGGYVCVASVNNVMEAHDSPEILAAMNGSELTTPDGMPLVWGLRSLGASAATRVYGPDLMPAILARAEEEGLAVGFYGGSPEALHLLVREVRTRWPKLTLAHIESPPFREPNADETNRTIKSLETSGTEILFVGLPTPKQDLWMARQRVQVRAVMVGVGAAFDFLSGRKRQAPRWMMRIGLEWLFRLATEPRRLWKRYLKHNPRFVVYFGWQLFRYRVLGHGRQGAA
ncbi:MAG: WecB/TagA/CpsF family glycosyltransferase [Acidobacteria bacterium]|nr:WecB/TagA/CpsF family glycosyltransferase [Acidobacteriota bacterium]